MHGGVSYYNHTDCGVPCHPSGKDQEQNCCRWCQYTQRQPAGPDHPPQHLLFGTVEGRDVGAALLEGFEGFVGAEVFRHDEVKYGEKFFDSR